MLPDLKVRHRLLMMPLLASPEASVKSDEDEAEMRAASRSVPSGSARLGNKHGQPPSAVPER